jgi:hypothetical protein
MKYWPAYCILLALIVGWIGSRLAVDGYYEVQITHPVLESAQKLLDLANRQLSESSESVIQITASASADVAKSTLVQTQSEIRQSELKEGFGIALIALASALIVGSFMLFRRRAIPSKGADTANQKIELQAAREAHIGRSDGGGIDPRTERFWLLGAALALLLFLVSVSIYTNPRFTTNPTPAPKEVSIPETSKSEEIPSSVKEKPLWSYFTVQMKAGSKTEEVGCLRSSEMVHLDSPYHDTYANLCFRSDNTIILELSGDGQILSDERYGAIVRVNNGPPRSYTIQRPSDLSSDKVFLRPAAPLITAAKEGKQIRIEVTYYQAGSQTSTFEPPVPLILK